MASVAAVADLVWDRYGLPAGSTCALPNRGFHDRYAVTTPPGTCLVLRPSGHRDRGRADVEADAVRGPRRGGDRRPRCTEETAWPG